MSRVPTIENYLERSADRAALVASLAMAREHPFGFLKYATDEQRAGLVVRQRRLLEDVLHDFAFTGRKLIELIRRDGFECVSKARESAIPCFRQEQRDSRGDAAPENDADDEEMMSLETVFGRIIHSDTFLIEASEPLPTEGPQTGPSLWAFIVATDRDQHAGPLLVFVELLIAEFLGFHEAVRRELFQRGPKLLE
jgi:hypothetical protein